MGCARDIVEHAGVPRFWFSNFPLGHSAGKPFHTDSQFATLRGALSLFDSAREPRTTEMSPQQWLSEFSWQDDFMDVNTLDAEAVAKLRANHEQVRAQSRELKG